MELGFDTGVDAWDRVMCGHVGSWSNFLITHTIHIESVCRLITLSTLKWKYVVSCCNTALLLAYFRNHCWSIINAGEIQNAKMFQTGLLYKRGFSFYPVCWFLYHSHYWSSGFDEIARLWLQLHALSTAWNIWLKEHGIFLSYLQTLFMLSYTNSRLQLLCISA